MGNGRHRMACYRDHRGNDVKRLYSVFELVLLLLAALVCSAEKVDVANKLTTLHENEVNSFISVNLSSVVVDNAVNVTCRQLQSGSRRANLLFGYAILPIGTSSSNISVSIVSTGDPVTVACSGFSLNNGTQYLLANSTGQSGNIVIILAPSVSICSDYVFVKGYTQSSQSFTVQLSEPAVNPVTVNCFVSSESSANANSMQLKFLQATVQQQQTQTTVTFSVQVAGQPVKVFCQAQSQNCLSPAAADVLATASSVSSMFSSTSNYVNPTALYLTTTIAMTNITSSSVSNESLLTSTSSNVSSYEITSASSSVNTIDISSSSLNALPFSSTLSGASSSKLPASVSFSISASSPLSAALSTATTTTTVRPSLSTVATCQYLFNTSQASSVNFVIKQPSIVAFPSYMDYSNLGDHVSYVVLDEALQGSSNLVLQCRIKQISVADIGESICGSDGLPTGGAPALALSDITLQLRESQITFKPGVLHANITIQILRFGNQSFSQLFHAFCCAPATSEKYRGQSVSVFFWMDGKGTFPFDWSNIPEQLQRQTTLVESLDSSCPCNLNENSCDLNCCCDKDCSSAEISRFVCISGAFGGRESSSFEFDCNAIWPDRTDWTPILCVVTNNSPLLGYFFKYTSPTFALSSSDFQTLSSGKTSYTFEENEARNMDNIVTSTGYTYGSSVKTDIGVLTLPSFVSETCAFTSVRFLMDKTSYCLHKVSRDACSKDSLDSLNFVLLDGLTFPSCNVPGVLDGRTSTSLASKTVEYYCLASSSNYVFQVTTPLVTQLAQESLFSTAVTSVADTVPRCTFDNGKTRPPQPSLDNSTNICQNAVLDVNYVMSWNSQHLKAVTAKITLGNIPLNTFTQSAVTYTFYTQRVVTSSFTALTSTLSFTQSQIAPSLFPSISQPSASYASVFPSTLALSSFSGSSLSSSVPNSSISLIVQSSTLRIPATISIVNNSSLPATPLMPSSSFNVSTAALPTPNLITFTVKTSTVIFQNFTIDPTLIQKFTVSYKYEKSVDANASVVSNGTASTPTSRSGNPGYIIGKPLISRINSTANVLVTDGLLLWTSTNDGLCTGSRVTPISFGRNSLSGCFVRIGLDRFSNCSELSSLIKASQDKLVSASHIAKRGNPSVSDPEDWLNIMRIEPSPSSARHVTRPGICYDIPSHVVFEVLVSEAGMRYGESQMEISGLKIRYVTETWSLNCSSGRDSGCYSSTDASSKFTAPFLKPFQLTSSVIFVKIPSVEPPRLKRSSVATGICMYDSCLQELFYPIMDAYSAHIVEFNLRITQNATAMAMTLVFIAFGALYVSNPWR